MSDLFSISAVDRREEAMRQQKAAHNNVAETQPQQEIAAQGETGRDGGGHKRGKNSDTLDEDGGEMPPVDPEEHNCDVTV